MWMIWKNTYPSDPNLRRFLVVRQSQSVHQTFRSCFYNTHISNQFIHCFVYFISFWKISTLSLSLSYVSVSHTQNDDFEFFEICAKWCVCSSFSIDVDVAALCVCVCVASLTTINKTTETKKKRLISYIFNSSNHLCHQARRQQRAEKKRKNLSSIKSHQNHMWSNTKIKKIKNLKIRCRRTRKRRCTNRRRWYQISRQLHVHWSKSFHQRKSHPEYVFFFFFSQIFTNSNDRAKRRRRRYVTPSLLFLLFVHWFLSTH